MIWLSKAIRKDGNKSSNAARVLKLRFFLRVIVFFSLLNTTKSNSYFLPSDKDQVKSDTHHRIISTKKTSILEKTVTSRHRLDVDSEKNVTFELGRAFI